MARRAPDAADLADLVVAFESDETASAGRLRERDAAIGARLDAAGAHEPQDRVLGWLDARREMEPGAPSSRDALRLAGTGSVLLGIVFGVVAAAGALAFDGASGRINVVWVIGLFVGLQAVTIVLTLLAFLPASVRGAIPGFGSVGLLRHLALRPLALRWVPVAARQRIEPLLGRGRAARTLLGEVQRWLVLTWSQSFSTGFNVGVLASLAALVVLTDLAFGWSTTLEVDARRVHAALRAFSAPWAWLWPAAVPSLELLEATRWFRVTAGEPPSVDPAVFGRFWPFLFAAITCYGLLPRVVLRVVAGWRLRRAVRDAIELHPEVPRLLARLDPLETRAQDTEEGAAAADGPEPARRALPGRAVVIDWADALGTEGPARLPLDAAPVLAAGGACSLAEDEQAIAAARDAEGPVLVAVRGYETPVLELRDFLAGLRGALGRGRAILFLPLDAPDDAEARWAHWLAPLGDPWLELVTGGPGDG